MILVELAILIYSVILHEIAHGFVADRLGDPTARLSKRLTLNPIPHIDPFYTIALPILLYFTSGMIFGAAKPIPIDYYNLRDLKKDLAIISLAGPGTNILIAIFFSILFHILPLEIFKFAVLINISLATINLVPIPPLDGFKILAGVLPNNIANQLYKLEHYGLTFVFLIFFFARDLIYVFTSPITLFFRKLLLP